MAAHCGLLNPVHPMQEWSSFPRLEILETCSLCIIWVLLCNYFFQCNFMKRAHAWCAWSAAIKAGSRSKLVKNQITLIFS